MAGFTRLAVVPPGQSGTLLELFKNSMRITNAEKSFIGYRLNILGVRVYSGYCQLIARVGDDWATIGSPRNLPVVVPTDPHLAGSDPLLLTAFQYEQEKPGSDLLDVLAGRKDFHSALNGVAHDRAAARPTGR
jgi:hypothetical protein